MNLVQMQYLCGIGLHISVQLMSGNTVDGILTAVRQDAIEVQTDTGATRALADEEIMDIKTGGLKKRFDTEEIRREAKRLKSLINQMVNPSPMKFNAIYGETLEQAAQALPSLGEAGELLDVLMQSSAIKDRILDAGTAGRCVQTASAVLEGDIRRSVQFLLWYGAGCFSEAMAVLTGELKGDGQPRSDTLYRQLGCASQLIGMSDAMTVYWLGKYYRERPSCALADNELCSDPLWLAYLDLCDDLLCFEGIDSVLDALVQLGDEGYRCACCSLYRLFSRGGRFDLAREAVAGMAPECNLGGLVRSVQELTIYLKSDTDGHCFFAAEAAELIQRQSQGQGVVRYSDESDCRGGYLYDFAGSRHSGWLLGYDLIPYFFPTSAISSKRLAEIKKGFDLSKYDGNRTLVDPFAFYAEPSFRRAGFMVKTLL